MSNQTVHFKNIRAKIIDNLKQAEKEILIAVAWFTDELIIQTLNDCANRGVLISIIIYDDKINNKDLFRKLFNMNANIRLSRKLMHNKFCVIDDNIVINGSYNWTYSAKSNDENIQITENNHDLAYEFKIQFLNLFDKCKEINDYFKSIEEKYDEYFTSSESPISFPCITEKKSFSNEKCYIVLKNIEDFKRLNRYEFNFKQRQFNSDITVNDLELDYRKIESGTSSIDFLNLNGENRKINYRFIYDVKLTEEVLYKEQGLLKVDKNLYIHIDNTVSLKKIYDDVFSWTEKYPDNITTVEELQEYVFLISKNKKDDLNQ